MRKSVREKAIYSSEFKEAAVAKCLEIGLSKASKELGVASSTLHHWKKQQEEPLKASSGNKPSYKDLELEVKKLRKEISYVNEINEVLKKSTAIFCSEQMDPFK